MVKLTFILIGLFVIIHFTMYYWNIDPFFVFNKKIEKQVEEIEEYDFGNLKDNLEDCLNELKQYNSINVNHVPEITQYSLESVD